MQTSFMKLSSHLILSMILLTSCGSSDDHITWEYTIPDGYEGWIAIQHNCAGGMPLDRQENIIRVTFDSDGLFCTTDPFFPWRGQEFAQDMSGNRIPVIGQPRDQIGYAVCCGQVMGSHVSELGKQVDVELQLRWVGNAENGYPSLNLEAINEDALAGELVPADW